MNSFDTSILLYLNQFSHQSIWFDTVMHAFKSSNILKSGIYMAMVWFAWFANTGPHDERKRRENALTAIMAAIIAPLVARLLVIVLPHRLRPVQNPDLPFQKSFFLETDNLDTWSSFPSEHATLFFTITVALFFVSRRLGLIALAYALFLSFVRVYLGLHYPTDIMGGMVVGAGVVLLLRWPVIKQLYVRPAFYIHEKYPGLFYAGMFLLCCEIEEMFFDIQLYLGHAIKYLF
ncbi:MAG: phosphatase PAP2 family protein [Alphaproteobacteria bacterium]|nr:phosphatase PAP2 family protein [Alphaproteobacteria bacterium]